MPQLDAKNPGGPDSPRAADASAPPGGQADGGTPADTGSGCVRPSPPGYLTGPDSYRWLVLGESTAASTNAVAFRVSAAGITGPWQLGNHYAIRGEGFSPEGRFFVRREWGEPAYLTDFGGSEPSDPTVLLDVAYEVSWSPSAPLLLLQDDVFEKSVTVMDARCGHPEIRSLELRAPPQLVNPFPIWAPDGERVGLDTNWGIIELVDFRLGSPVVAAIDKQTPGFGTSSYRWSPDGRWLASSARPKPGSWLVAGIDSTGAALSIVPLTQTMSLEIEYVQWADRDWLFFPTSEGSTSQSTYLARLDVLPATPTAALPGSALLSPAGSWIAYLGNCDPSAADGICLVQLGPEGPSEPIQVATAEPVGIYWSPGGKHLYYVVRQGDHNEWWLIPNVTTGGHPIQPTQEAWWNTTWSPDSDFVLWQTGEGSDEKHYAYHVARAANQLLLGGDVEDTRWSNDGAFLAVVTADGAEVIVFAKQGSTLVELARLTSTTGAFALWCYWQPVPL